ncbi:MAG: response regulator, partial [Planctomycetota bacterium]
AYAELLGVDDYLRKPFAMDKLIDSVRRLLG